MKLFGKEIKPEVATMWVNIAGFITSIIFYFSVEHSFVKPVPVNPLQAELVNTDTKLTQEIKLLKAQQDSLCKVMTVHEQQLSGVQKQVTKQMVRITSTLRSDWDSLSQEQKEKYTEALIQKLKNKKR